MEKLKPMSASHHLQNQRIQMPSQEAACAPVLGLGEAAEDDVQVMRGAVGLADKVSDR